MAFNDEEVLEAAPDNEQQEQAPAQATPENDYISKVHATLKDNIAGFDKSEDEFRKLITTDPEYRKKVHATLKDNIEGFDKTPEVFDDSVGVKKKEAGQSGSTGMKVQPGQPLPASGSSAGKITDAEGLINNGKQTAQPFSPAPNTTTWADITGLTPGLVNKRHSEALNTAIGNLNKIDLTKEKEDIVKQDIQKTRLSKVQSMIQQNPIDNTANTQFNQRVEALLPKDMPVQLADDEVNDIKQNADQDQRRALMHYAQNNPSKAGQIKKDLYLVDSKDRGNKAKILDNAAKIDKGDYDYSIWHGGVVQKKVGPVDAFLNGWHERNKELDDYEDFAKLDKKGSINKLEDERNSFDPDEPVLTPKGVTGEISGMLGSNAIPMAKAAAVSTLSTLAMAPEAAPWLAAAITTPEYGARAHVASLKATYNQLRDSGMSEDKAFDIANRQATIDAAAAAAQGALQTYAGIKLGGAVQPFKIAPGVKGIIGEALNTTKEFAKHSLPNAATVGGLEVAKNLGAKLNGVDRDVTSNVLEAAGGQLMFEAGLGLISKGFHVASKALPKYKQAEIKQNLAQAPQEQIDAALANHVVDGTITPEAATETRNELQQQRDMDALIPPSVKNPEIRLQIQKLIERKQAHEETMQTVDKSFHAGIKEKILKIDEDIADLAATPEAKEAPAEEKAVTPETGKPETAGDAIVPPATASEGKGNSPQETAGNTQEYTEKSVIPPEKTPEKATRKPQEQEPISKEQPLETNNHKVVYEDGKRVAMDKEGNKIPEYTKDKDGKTVKNRRWTNVMRKHEEAYNYNFGERAPEGTQQFDNEKDAATHFVESSNNPAEIAEAYKSVEKEPLPVNSVEKAIAEHGGVGKVKASSFDEFDDPNNRNNSLARTYLVGKDNPKGSTLDQIAQEISTDGLEVTPEDIANYMKRFPGGKDPLKPGETEIHEAAKEKFEKLTGIPLNDRTAALAVEQLRAKEIPKTTEQVHADAEKMPDDNSLKLASDIDKSHNFEDDGTDTIHPEVQSSDNGEAENGSVHKQQTATPAGEHPTGNVHAHDGSESGKPQQAAESGTAQSDKSEAEHRALADDFDEYAWKPVEDIEGFDKVVSREKNETTGKTDEYLNKGAAVLNQLFPDHKIVVHETTADYVEKTGRSPLSAGVFDPKTKTIALNKELIDKTNSGNTVFHEVIHPIVKEALQSRPEAVNDAYSKLVSLQGEQGMDAVWKHENQYRDRGTDTMKVEAITEFLSLVADGKIDASKLSANLSTKIIDLVNRIFKALGIDRVISTPTDLKRLAESIKKSFDTEDASHIASVIGKDKFNIPGETFDNLKNSPIQEWVNKHLAAGKDESAITAVLKEKLGINDKQARDFFNQAPEEMAKKEKYYEEIVGAKPFVGVGRIPVDPIIGGEVKNLSQISADLATNTEQKIFNMKPGRRAAGTYTPGSSGIKIKYTGDLDTTAHEIGHSLDDQFKILPNLPVQAKYELAPFIKFGSNPPKGHPNPAAYRLSEGFAEWLRAYVVNPAKAITAAPETFKAYNSLVPENYRNGIQTFSDDVRIFAGASGRDQTLANLSWKPEEKKDPTLLDQILNRSDPKKIFKIQWGDKFAINFVNPMHILKKGFEYAKGIKGIDQVLPQDDPIVLARLLLSNDRKFGEFMTNGFHDAKDQPILDHAGKPQNFKWLLEPLDNTDEASLTREAKTTAAYMLAERTVELESKFGRENVLSGIGGGVFKDIDVAKKTLDEIKNGDPELYKRVQEAADRYRAMSDNLLKYMVDKGRLSQDQYENIKKDNLYYVAMNRIIEMEPGQELQVVGKSSGALGSKTEIIKSIKGSTREIQNPYLSLLDNIHRGIKEADRNEVLQVFNDMVSGRRNMHQGEVEKLAEIGVEAKLGDKETITVFTNGKAKLWKYQPDIYASLKGLDNDAKSLPGYLTLHARLLRSMTTRFPTFAVRNWVRDFQDRLIKSNDHSGFRDLFGDKKHWEDVARNGGLNSGYYMKSATHYYGLMEEAMKGLAKEKKTIFADPTRLKMIWHGYENILEKGETSNRVAEYRAAMRQAKARGMDDYNASLYGAFKSRDLMDFAVMGHHMRVINQLIPFSNAAVQGLRSSIVRAKENPGGFLGRMAAYTVLPQAALWMMNHRNKDDGDEYENLPSYQRDMFWNVKIGPDNWLAIPKPYELGMLASGVDRGLSHIMGYNQEAFSGYAGSVAKVVTPIDVSNVLGPVQTIAEVASNHDFFRDKSIIPEYENGLDLSLRHTERGSRFGQAIQKVAGMDSRMVDHVIRSQFSYVGNFAIKLSDIGSGKDKEGFDLPDLGLFKKSPAYNSPHVQEVLDFASKWNLHQNAGYKEFKDLVGGYFDAKGNKEKDAAAKVLNDYAKDLIHEWKASSIMKDKQEAFKERRDK